MIHDIIQFVLSQLPHIPGELWDVLLEMAPYLLLGFAVAGVLSVMVSPALVERHLGGRGIWPVLKAAGVGVPLPLCSCGVIPVSASLRRHGASRGATTAFLISTPQTGVDSIAVTYSLLGGIFAIFRPIAALLSGVLGGVIVDAADVRSDAKDHTSPGGDAHPFGGASAGKCTDSCCAEGEHGGRIRRAIVYATSTLPRDLVRPLIVGVIVAAMISAFVPKDFFATSLGKTLGSGIVGILVMMALGIPTYVCATASVPMAWALMAKGVSPGAAFAFLVAGPATNAATIAMVWKVMGPRTAMIYLGTIAFSAIAGGLVLDSMPVAWFSLGVAGHAGHHMDMSMPELIFKNTCAIALLGMLAAALVRGKPKEEVAREEGVDTKGFDVARISIAGMTCSHCASTIERALRELDGVESAKVDLSAGRATVNGEALDSAKLRAAIEGLGYVVKDIAIESKETL